MNSPVDAAQDERKKLLIRATMNAVVDYGFSNLTLAKIAGYAGMTAASVNFHFKNKETLLLATLQAVADEYQQVLEGALAKADDDPLAQLLALCEATLDESITSQSKMAVWFAFSLESRTRDDYEVICGARDRFYYQTIERCCQALVDRSEYPDRNAQAIGYALAGLIDHLWQDFLASNQSHEQATTMARQYIEAMFPGEFDLRSARPKATDSITFLLMSTLQARGTHCIEAAGRPVWVSSDHPPIDAVCGETGLMLASPGTLSDAKCPLHGKQCLTRSSVKLQTNGELISVAESAVDIAPVQDMKGFDLVDDKPVALCLLEHEVKLANNATLTVHSFKGGIAVIDGNCAAVVAYRENRFGGQTRQLFCTRHLTRPVQKWVAASNQLAHCN